VNKLPNVDTDVPSNLSVRGEVAFLKPDSPKADQFEGESTIYVDDFEGSQNNRHAFIVLLEFVIDSDRNTRSRYDFNANANDLSYGFKRSRLAWYSIDPIFYSKLSEFQMTTCHNTTRRIYSEELYPLTDIAQGQSQVINTLDLSYYPSERGAYNNEILRQILQPTLEESCDL
jgi:cell surface protein SprA